VDSSKKLGASHVKLTEANRISFLHFFTYCVDIRNACLKKSLLRTLAEYCSDKEDETRLLELCSKEGNEQYMKMIKEDHLSLLDVLNVFKSCKPSISHLIQMLPALSTRSYTLCSFNEKEKSSNELEVVFNIVKFNQERNRTYERNGIATGYLTCLKLGDDLYFMKRRFQNFTFPNECLSKPIIMIGPGTGIAPFMSFLRSQHAQAEKSLAQNNLNLYLFYGCRDPIQDFLFKDELTKKLVYLLKKFSVSYSRTDENCIEQHDSINKEFHVTNSKYVQDSIRFYSKDIIEQVYDQDGYIYVCGDAQNMSKDVLNCFIECLSAEKNFSVEESNKYFSEMIKSKRYKQDIWS
jgi:methionine synthase reductase